MTIRVLNSTVLACWSAVVLCLSQCSMVAAQEGAGPQHEILKKFDGEWVSSSKSVATEGVPEMQCSGTASYKMLGDLWLIGEVKGDMGGSAVNALQTIGYDSAQEKYIGTWVDSMMNHMWRYEGTWDESSQTLTLEAEGPNFTSPGKTAKFRDSYQFKSADHIVATSSMQEESGKWVKFMVGDVKRK